MKYSIVCALLAFLVTDVVQAQDTAKHAPRKKSPRITLVIDVSGSMYGHLADAISTAINIAIAPTDDLEIGVITFSDNPIRIIDPVTKKRWFRLPSKPIADALRASLRGLSSGGGTNPVDALRQAFSERTQSIVLITDGGWYGLDPTKAIKKCQKKLLKAKKWIPNFVILAIKTNDYHKKKLDKLAKATGGVVWAPRPRIGPQVKKPRQKPSKGPKKAPKAPKKTKTTTRSKKTRKARKKRQRTKKATGSKKTAPKPKKRPKGTKSRRVS